MGADLEAEAFAAMDRLIDAVKQSAAAQVRAMGMLALNQQRIADGHSIAYDEAEFERLAVEVEA